MDVLSKISAVTKNISKKKTIRDLAVENLFHAVRDYSDWYEEHGLQLPPDYATDPTGWTIDLQKMKRSFFLLHEELHGRGDLWEAKNKWAKFGEGDGEKIKELEKEITEGLSLFGKYLLYLTDTSNKK